jgi:hypothetical protein
VRDDDQSYFFHRLSLLAIVEVLSQSEMYFDLIRPTLACGMRVTASGEAQVEIETETSNLLKLY